MYPLTLRNSFNTRVKKFMNDTEQRWTVSNVMFSAELQFHSLNGYDLSLLYNFFQAMHGSYVDTALIFHFQITLAGITYDYCVFDQDTFEAQVGLNETYSVTLKIKQIRQT